MTVKNAAGLPPSLSHFVFCQYNFWGESDPTIVPPTDSDPNSDDILKLGQTTDVSMFTFNHTRTFTIPVTDEFMDHCSEGALSIEVYGHRSAGFASTAQSQERNRLARSLADRYGICHFKKKISKVVRVVTYDFCIHTQRGIVPKIVS